MSTVTADPASGGIGTDMTADVRPLPAHAEDRYADWSLDAIIADFVLVRGDLDEAYAREQFARAVLASADVADREAVAFAEGRAVQASEVAAFCRREAGKADPVTGDHATPTYWNGHNAALRQVADRQQARIAEGFTFAADQPVSQPVTGTEQATAA